VGVHGGRRPGHGEEAAVWADSGLGLGAVGIDGNDGNDTPVVGPGCVGELTGLTQTRYRGAPWRTIPWISFR
jgi:hypothetical protein